MRISTWRGWDLSPATISWTPYGPMSGPLHRGTPTDRLIAEWWMEQPHVVRRRGGSPLVVRSRDVLAASPVMSVQTTNGWDTCGDVRTDLDDQRLLVPIPSRFGEMQLEATELALAWRLAARDAFRTYFSRGYVAVDFFLNRERGGGQYLLSRTDQAPGQRP